MWAISYILHICMLITINHLQPIYLLIYKSMQLQLWRQVYPTVTVLWSTILWQYFNYIKMRLSNEFFNSYTSCSLTAWLGCNPSRSASATVHVLHLSATLCMLVGVCFVTLLILACAKFDLTATQFISLSGHVSETHLFYIGDSCVMHKCPLAGIYSDSSGY